MLLYMFGMLTVAVAFLGLIVDMGMMESMQLKLQNAADAAVYGAVYAAEDGTSMTNAAIADAKLNGFTAGVNGVTVAIANPPTTGPYAGNSSNVQATVTQPFTPKFFPVAVTLKAQAVAAVPPRPCTYFLSQYYTGLSLQASNESLTPACTLYFGLSYNVSSSNGAQFLLHGDLSKSTGAYCGGINLTTTGTVTFQPGLFIITGNFNATLTHIVGTGVTFFMTSGGGSGFGTFTLTNVVVTLSAPTTGALQGIIFFSDRNMPPLKPAGVTDYELNLSRINSPSSVDGIFYLPKQSTQISQSGLTTQHYFGVVADWANIHNGVFTPKADYSPLANGNPLHLNSVQALR